LKYQSNQYSHYFIIIKATNPPSISPTTREPTQTPSSKPTPLAPTLSPITLSPSLSPIAAPTTEMPITDLPTKQPIKEPVIVTGSPTRQPVVGPIFSRLPTSEPIPTTSAPTPVNSLIRMTESPTVSSKPSSGEAAVIPPTIDTDDIITPPTSGGGSPDSVETGEDRETEDSDTISAGGIAGIVIASAFVAYSAAYVYAKKRRRDEVDDPDLREVRNKDLDDLEAGIIEGGDDGGGGDNEPTQDKKTSDGGGEVDKVNSLGNGETPPVLETTESYDASDYIPSEARSPSSTDVPLISGVPPSPKRSKVGKETTSSYDDSSSAGESGWSSSAGLSSLNTASFDAGSMTDDGSFLPLPGSPDRNPDRLMATIGAAEAATAMAGSSTQQDARPSFIPTDNSLEDSDMSYDENMPMQSAMAIHSDHPTTQPLAQPKVTRDDLNAAIEAGDWAVVGATAALLADTDHSSSMSMSESEQGLQPSIQTSESFQTETSESNHRAEELDRMVEAGNWEGVVLAAAQFEGASPQDENTQFSSNVDSSSSPSTEDKEAIRAEVERLVRRVVPDEIDNIDEMMLQFEGREPELVETLRTMQERSVAQRARAAVQKTAKLEAKTKAALSNRSDGSASSSSLSHYGGSASNSSVSDYQDDSYSTGGEDSSSLTDSSVSDLGSSLMTSEESRSGSRKTTQSSLELAIEKGDWRAVGEAAAMMGSGDGGDSLIIQDDSGSSSFNSSIEESSKAERVNRLDKLIAKGDWAGIVAAAGTYQAMDDSGVGDTGPKTQEEKDALASASMWQEIADQAKPQGGKDEGAADAAKWAIERAHIKSNEPTKLREDDQSV